MLSLPASVRVFVCCEPADMRRSFDSLARMAAQFTQADPLSGHLFVFCNRRADRVKILYWDLNGYAFYAELGINCQVVLNQTHECSSCFHARSPKG